MEYYTDDELKALVKSIKNEKSSAIYTLLKIISTSCARYPYLTSGRELAVMEDVSIEKQTPEMWELILNDASVKDHDIFYKLPKKFRENPNLHLLALKKELIKPEDLTADDIYVLAATRNYDAVDTYFVFGDACDKVLLEHDREININLINSLKEVYVPAYEKLMSYLARNISDITVLQEKVSRYGREYMLKYLEKRFKDRTLYSIGYCDCTTLRNICIIYGTNTFVKILTSTSTPIEFYRGFEEDEKQYGKLLTNIDTMYAVADEFKRQGKIAEYKKMLKVIKYYSRKD